jgi:hypothetical protein
VKVLEVDGIEVVVTALPEAEDVADEDAGGLTPPSTIVNEVVEVAIEGDLESVVVKNGVEVCVDAGRQLLTPGGHDVTNMVLVIVVVEVSPAEVLRDDPVPVVDASTGSEATEVDVAMGKGSIVGG